ncbi:MAG: hypothetical protein DRR19_02195 [Candidatus Parabeggiatoa sp. nov. 1]|nr:MAG: hypothetical protein DRR19_02195 [Gammaproteobacteria bacterium]
MTTINKIYSEARNDKDVFCSNTRQALRQLIFECLDIQLIDLKKNDFLGTKIEINDLQKT